MWGPHKSNWEWRPWPWDRGNEAAQESAIILVRGEPMQEGRKSLRHKPVKAKGSYLARLLGVGWEVTPADWPGSHGAL